MRETLPDRNAARCPVCGSAQLSATRRGYSGCGGILGFLLFGWIGLLLGLLGYSDPRIVCLNCGHEFAPPSRASCSVIFIIAGAIMLLACLIA